jgi:hypothetical protein
MTNTTKILLLAFLLTATNAHADSTWTPEVGNYNPDTSTAHVELASIEGVPSCGTFANDLSTYQDEVQRTWNRGAVAYLGDDLLRLTNRDLRNVQHTENQIGGWDPSYMPKAGALGFNFSLLRVAPKNGKSKIMIYLNISGFAADGTTVVCHDTVSGDSQPVVK